MKNKLSAQNLEDTLWETIQKIRSGKIKPQEANAVSMASKEILNSVRLQIQYTVLSGDQLKDHRISFFERSMKRAVKEGRKAITHGDVIGK